MKRISIWWTCLASAAFAVACADHTDEPTAGASERLSATDGGGDDDDDTKGGQTITRAFGSFSACVDTMGQMPAACSCSCSDGSQVVMTCHCP